MLAVQCLPVAAFASRVPGDATRAGDDLLIESGPGAFHHVHYLRIPKTLLAAPPAGGVTLTSTKAFLHQHRIVLTQEDLRSVDHGGTVSQQAGSHLFVIALAKGITKQPE